MHFFELGPSRANTVRDEETSYNPSVHSMTTDPETTLSAANNVNRNTSVRSVLTLPAYNPSPRPDERLIAREGERGGVDTVVEFPETHDEEEARREEDMEALYQIRQSRRREIEERNERRRERQEAREQGDWARLEQLRLDQQRRARERSGSNASAGSSTISLPQAASSRELIAEHNARQASRERRISSVSYADLGTARHDGTRLRAESVESDHRPLLDNAAAISGNSTAPSGEGSNEATRSRSRFHLPIFARHSRSASAESIVTTDSEALVEASRSGSTSQQAVRTPSGSGSGSGSNGNPPVLTPSESEPSPPIGQPPGYQEPSDAPPDYSSPIRDRGEGVPRLPSVRVNTDLPAIEIVESTPTVASGHTPFEDRQ